MAGTLPGLTVALIAVSVALSLASRLGASVEMLLPFFIGLPGAGLALIWEGEIWRLLTPIFLHFGALHLLFNMLWLWDLGGLVEHRRGLWYFAGFVVAVGIASNLTQYSVTGSPFFGGMSGVVYGLLGYVWMQGRYNPWFGYALRKEIVIMMLVWYVVCWTGLVGPIANWAHTAGLAIGVAWGYMDRGGRRFGDER